MKTSQRAARRLAVFALALGLLIPAGVAGAAPPWVTVTDDFSAEPALFGLAAAPGHTLMVADAGAGPTEIRDGDTSVVHELLGVTDVAPIGQGDMLALTSPGFGGAGTLNRVSKGRVRTVADVTGFEEEFDPAADGVDSNPFDLARMNGGKTLVADAAANSLLIVDENGDLDWVAAFPQKPITCLPPLCGPTPIPFPPGADPVPTSVAIGPDGAYYVGELTGFPGTPGNSNVWRIAPGTRHALCGISSACSIVGTGFTSIIDLQFGPDGKAYVVELDEASWFAIEPGSPLTPLGGTINACTPAAVWSCTVRAGGLPLPTAIAFQGSALYSTLLALVPGQAQVALIP